MKQMKTAAALAIAAITTLAACGKEQIETPEVEDGNTSAIISLAYPAKTRAAGPAVDTQTAEFKPGHIFFTNAAGKILVHVTVGKTPPISGVTSYSLNDLTNPAGSEVVVANIPSSATRCYILSNDDGAKINGLNTDMKGKYISTILNATVHAININDNTGGLSNAPIFGVGSVVSSAPNSTTATNHTHYTAEVNVQLNSLVSHLQIKKISAKEELVGGDKFAITAFNVDGIYLNKVNPRMTIKGDLTTAIDNLSDPANYSSSTSGSAYYSTGALYRLSDEPRLIASGLPLAVSPSQGAWGYNVFPQTEVPSIIVKLSNVKYITNGTNEQTIPGNMWLTISSYKEGSVPVTSFKANQIYTLSDIKFALSDLTAVPNTKQINVNVKVTMFDWVNHELVWGR